MSGTEYGKLYGSRHQGSGRMPGFGVNPNNGDTSVPQLGAQGMLTPEEVWALVAYERAMSTERPDLRANALGAPSTSTPRTTGGSASGTNGSTTTTTTTSVDD
jgi:hypothetical protein